MLNTSQLTVEDIPDLRECSIQLLSQEETAIFSETDRVILILNSSGKVKEYVRYGFLGAWSEN